MKLGHVATKEEADAGGTFAPWKPGDYEFEVHGAADDVSDAGNEMIKLTLWVFDADGNKRTVFDYLTGDEKSSWKVRHFAEAIGLLASYERGELDPYDIEGKTGKLKLRIKPANTNYPANNSVQDYIPLGDLPEKTPRPAARASAPTRGASTGGASRPAVPSTSREMDDEIPFAPQWQ